MMERSAWRGGEAKHPHLICKQNLDEPRPPPPYPDPPPPVCRAQRHCKSQCCSSGLLCTKTRARPDASSTPTDVDGPPRGGAVRGVFPPSRRPPVPLRGILSGLLDVPCTALPLDPPRRRLWPKEVSVLAVSEVDSRSCNKKFGKTTKGCRVF